jgi:hypothetical protein
MRIGLPGAGNIERIFRDAGVDQNRRAVGAESKGGISATARQMMDIEKPGLPGVED